jgi:NAD(P)-dependent dehydrogenase (short-subunit alcohol dehydrogenase family)
MSDVFPNVFSLDGQVALITGGGTGIGLGMARCMTAAGAKVVLVGRRQAELEKACAELGSLATYEAYDVTQFDGVAAMLDRVVRRVGPITILSNNAGIHLKKPVMETSIQAFEDVLRTHVLAAHHLSCNVLPGMIARKSGNIIFTASMASLFGIPLVGAYAAAKSAHLGLVRTMAVELSPHGVRVNAIAPGWIDTPIWQKSRANDPQRANHVLQRTPMGRFGTAEEIGWAAVYLCSSAASFVTGVVLPVDGGVSVGF